MKSAPCMYMHVYSYSYTITLCPFPNFHFLSNSYILQGPQMSIQHVYQTNTKKWNMSPCPVFCIIIYLSRENSENKTDAYNVQR